MGADFLKGYTELADGEKDPRNLLLAFSIDRVLLLEFDVKPYIEVRFPYQGYKLWAYCPVATL